MSLFDIFRPKWKNKKDNQLVGSTYKSNLTSMDAIVATVTTSGGIETKLHFDDTIPSGTMVVEAQKLAGIKLEPNEFEIIKEDIERSRGLEGGFKFEFSINLDEGVSFKFEKKPSSEKRTVTKATFRQEK